MIETIDIRGWFLVVAGITSMITGWLTALFTVKSKVDVISSKMGKMEEADKERKVEIKELTKVMSSLNDTLIRLDERFKNFEDHQR